ncbi:L-type lectin-domain containing receptor kinase IX.1-like [Carya illinoinensis]|uniref:Protein kinase domain-containing protein n=1 Tax=Carya illinoinensis TaxID=32201 RepID=A0A8T1QC87_CARIL|nr:L-type lectin-domain containing receptor kinase IX.1-like [Carya illinoinensis]KAG6652106.1 hypothetical protein CIPAW_06G160000 [Carya illinoinensis]KAG6710009.1 hypothetical protein I3842_06G160800 [Carya illinoinensis]
MVGFKYFKIKHFLFPNPPVLFYLLMLSNLFSLVFPFTSTTSFNFTSFNSDNHENMSYERAFAEFEVIQLTGNRDQQGIVGRVTYYSPMHLWDNASTNLADFTTHFSFVIDAKGKTVYGDGLAFFLAPHGSKIPDNVYEGGTMGLTPNGQSLNRSKNQFVAVEFDISQNDWDPPGEHVGIDINSMESVANASWWSSISIREGEKNEAWISYNSTTHNLSVVFTGLDQYNVTVRQFLSGIVDLRDYVPEWVTFGFSAATGGFSAMHTIYSWDFNSSLEIDDTNTNKTVAGAPSPSPILTPKPRGNNKLGLGVGLGVGGLFLVAGLGLVLLLLWKRSGRDKEDDRAFAEYMDGEFQGGTGPKRFSFRELARATNNFRDEEKLGQGGFGGVYKGFLRDSNIFVAIKRVSKGSKQGIKEYAAEVKIISRLRHRNLVQLIGWCHERRELILVYEFMPNGSLDSHLFNKERLLIWEARYKIAQGLASSLFYLHEEWEQCVVHRDIKSSNIMLDSNFNARLGDFGLARLVDHAKGSQTTVLAGTFGYMAPECVTTGKASKESDVYSFGIVVLEIACGRKPINPKGPEGQVVLVEWVWELYGKGEVLGAADPRLGGDFDREQMEHLIIVGMWCAHPNRNLRPSIKQAIHVLNFEAPLPILPSSIPGLAYLPPTMNRSSMPLLKSDAATSSESSEIRYLIHSQNTISSQFTSSSSAEASLLHSC